MKDSILQIIIQSIPLVFGGSFLGFLFGKRKREADVLKLINQSYLDYVEVDRKEREELKKTIEQLKKEVEVLTKKLEKCKDCTL